MSTLNWNDLVKDAGSAGTSFEALPDGDYDLRVVEAETVTTQSGKTMFKLKTEVVNGAYAKRFLWDNLVISPENPTAMGFFFRKMKAVGLGTEFFERNPSPSDIERALAGRTFKGQVGSRVYQGQNRNEIKNYFPDASTGTPTFAPSAPAPVAAAAPAPAPAAAPAPVAAPAPAVAPPVATPVTPPAAAPAPVQNPWEATPAPAPGAVDAPPTTPF